ATTAIKNAAAQPCVSELAGEHRRGPFPAAAIGISYGGGQKKPGNLRLGGPEIQNVLEDLIKNKGIQRLAGFAASGFATYAPRTYGCYNRTMEALLAGHSDLRRNFKNFPWAAMTFNMGPQTVCFPHLDSGNLPWGWCGVTTIGEFHPDFWRPPVIRFPPGATILIQSALMKHSNTLIRDGETRYSVTQYSAGGLFRLVENGLASDKKRDAEAKHDPALKAKRDAARATRWQRGLDMLSHQKEFWPQA
ncbi:hypothetical protein BDN71DRAFT_1553933, partial [Pleurotus eryngii]